jgi:hypothetical protein
VDELDDKNALCDRSKDLSEAMGPVVSVGLERPASDEWRGSLRRLPARRAPEVDIGRKHLEHWGYESERRGDSIRRRCCCSPPALRVVSADPR